MTAAQRILGLHRERWERIGPNSTTTAATVVIAASVFLALNRFGGLVTVEPRAVVRLSLVGVWGWLGMATIVWVVVAATTPSDLSERTQPVLAVIGLAHVPLLWLAGVLFLSAGVLQLLWPGLVTAVFVFAFWFPATVFVGLRFAGRLGVGRAALATSVSYGAWLAVVGRHLHDQLAHLV